MFPLRPRLALLVAALCLGWSAPALAQSLFVVTPPKKAEEPEALDKMPRLPNPRELPEKGEGKDPEISLTPPTPEQLFQVRSEEQLLLGIRKEAEDRGIKVSFPDSASHSTTQEPFPGRPHQQIGFVAASVCHGPLYFEDKNSERYGWTIPHLQPLASAGRFYAQALTFPFHLLLRSPCDMECSTGLPLPGDAVPFAIYLTPSKWTLTIHAPR